MVVGPACSGKSTLAHQLGQVLGSPVIELDALFWRAGWNPAPEAEFNEALTTATSGERWIVDGHYERTWPTLWPHTDVVIWLDLPLRMLLWRGLKRSFRRVRTREQLWGSNTEELLRQLAVWDPDRSLLGWLLRSFRGRRAAYVAACTDQRWRDVRFIRLCSGSEVAAFLAAVSDATRTPPDEAR